MIKIKLPRGCFMAILVFYSPVIIGMSFSSEPDVRNPGLFGSIFMVFGWFQLWRSFRISRQHEEEMKKFLKEDEP
jgi:hypothetical protein